MIRIEMDWLRHNTVVVGDEQYFGLEQNGTVHLVSNRCPHRGGPLQLGTIGDGRLRCPWHGNTFRVDRLCDHALPAVQRGNHIVAYVPAPGDAVATPVHALIFAKNGAE